MRRALALVALGLAAGCASRPGAPRQPAVAVTSLQLSFPERDRGELAFSLRLPPGRARLAAVSWELFLDGARLAQGLSGEVTPLDGLFAVKAPLALRHLAWRDGEATVDVVLQGDVDTGDGAERQRFRERRDVVVQGRPQLNIPRD